MSIELINSFSMFNKAKLVKFSWPKVGRIQVFNLFKTEKARSADELDTAMAR